MATRVKSKKVPYLDKTYIRTIHCGCGKKVVLNINPKRDKLNSVCCNRCLRTWEIQVSDCSYTSDTCTITTAERTEEESQADLEDLEEHPLS